MVQTVSETHSPIPEHLSLDAFVDLIFMLDAEGRFVHVARSSERILGRRPEALRGTLLADALGEPYRPALGELMNALRQGRDPDPYECEIVRGADDEQVPVELSLRPRFHAGKIVAYQGLIREIWQRRNKSDKLLEQKRRFAVLDELAKGMQSAPGMDALYRSTLERMLTLIRYDDGALYLLRKDKTLNRCAWQGDRGLFPADLGADGSSGALLPETFLAYPRLLDSDNTVSRPGILEHMRNFGRHSSLLVPMTAQGKLKGVILLANGEKLPLDSGLRVLLAQIGGQLGQTLENRGLQEEIRELRLRFDDMSESSVDHIWEVDRDGDYTYNSGGALQLMGYRPEELKGKHLVDFVHEEDREQTRRILNELQERKQPINGLIHRVIAADDKQVYVEIRAFPIFDVRGEVSGYRGIDRNMTDWFESKRLMEETLIGTCEALSRMVELRDPYTKGHSLRVAALAVFLGKHMRRTSYELQGLRLMGLLHDIGKVGIPTEILSKPGRLGPEEMELMRQHPMMSYEILKDISFPWPVAKVVRHHHERLDGTGYPDGLEGADLPWQVRLLAVADLLEAMATDRPYRPGLGLDLALGELQLNKGLLYDTDVVDTVMRLAEGGELQKHLERYAYRAGESQEAMDEETLAGIIEEELGRKPEGTPELEEALHEPSQ